MKITPIIIALFVSAFLYLMVFERERLLEFAAVPMESEDAAAQADTGQKAPDLISVIATPSKAQPTQSAIVLRGRTEADRQVVVRAETSGKVVSEPRRKGARVKTGETLCQLDRGTRDSSLAQAKAQLIGAQSTLPEARARMAQAKAQMAGAEAALAEAQINENAARKLKEGGFASETRLASATAALQQARSGIETANAAHQSALAAAQSASASIEAAKAAVAAIEQDIENLSIKAPFAGLLETDTAELGALLQPGAPCATVIQLNPIKLVGFAPETAIDKLSLGATAGARTATGREVSGKITFVSHSADLMTRTFRVEVEVPNPDLTIRDGQSVEILILTPDDEAHLLPQSALTLNDHGDLGVRFVGPGDVVDFAPVRILRDSLDGVWVSGLPDQVNVITAGHEYVTKGVKVAVTYQEASQ
ncbi:MAG: efflux transporter periplasmic adaptor subunit [Rhodobacterales bacterium]|nr:MAG: efflux transporter periplasmic adaptor subunit [Rhodobacterales bacterium]